MTSSKVKMSNEVRELDQTTEEQVNEIASEQASQDDSSSESSNEASEHGSEESSQSVSEQAKNWMTRYEQFLYGVVVGGAAVVCSLSVRSLLRSK